jgi:hypothetical protein
VNGYDEAYGAHLDEVRAWQDEGRYYDEASSGSRPAPAARRHA